MIWEMGDLKQASKLVGYLALILNIILMVTTSLLGLLLLIAIIEIFLYGKSKNKEIKPKGCTCFVNNVGLKLKKVILSKLW